MKKQAQTKVLRTKLKKEKEVLRVIMFKLGNVFDIKFYAMFIRNFTEYLTLRRLPEYKEK